MIYLSMEVTLSGSFSSSHRLYYQYDMEPRLAGLCMDSLQTIHGPVASNISFAPRCIFAFIVPSTINNLLVPCIEVIPPTPYL